MNPRTLGKLMAEPGYNYPEWLEKFIVKRASTSPKVAEAIKDVRADAEALYDARAYDGGPHNVVKGVAERDGSLNFLCYSLDTDMRTLLENLGSDLRVEIHAFASFSYAPNGSEPEPA